MRRFLGIAVLVVGLTAVAAAQNAPKAELFGGYSFVHSSIVGTGFNYNGGIGSVTGNMNDWFGIEAEFAGYHTGSNGVSGSLMTYSAGPKLAYRKNDHMTPYVHVLFGGAHSSASFAGVSASDNAFAMAFGGGVDANMSSRFALRLFQADYAMTKFTDGVDNRQNNFRVSTGVVVRW